MKNGVPFALLFTRVASDAQLLLLKKHYGTFCKEYGNIGFDYLKVFLSISNTYIGFIICLRVLLINLLCMPINWYRLIFGWDLPHLGIRMWQCGWWCYRKGIFSCFLFNLLEFYSNAAITMIISSQFTHNTQRKDGSRDYSESDVRMSEKGGFAGDIDSKKRGVHIVVQTEGNNSKTVLWQKLAWWRLHQPPRLRSMNMYNSALERQNCRLFSIFNNSCEKIEKVIKMPFNAKAKVWLRHKVLCNKTA